jgi:dihydroorotate dehydrogenase electron transfer subunit
LSRLIHAQVPITLNEVLAERTYRLRLETPALARAVRPGQFLMIRLPQTSDPLLGRPFALYDTVLDDAGEPSHLDIVYLVIGKLTSRLAALRTGDTLEVWGPLGNGFPDLSGQEHVTLVAGGIGQTPFLAYVRELLGRRGYGGRPAHQSAQRVSLVYGVRTAALAAGVADFRAAGAEVHLATDDGSLGSPGLVTDLLKRRGSGSCLIGCGPEPMLRALLELARGWEVPCFLSLETPMACGIGICFSCVTPVRTPDGWDYRRVCVDGPVFDAAQLAWSE